MTERRHSIDYTAAMTTMFGHYTKKNDENAYVLNFLTYNGLSIKQLKKSIPKNKWTTLKSTKQTIIGTSGLDSTNGFVYTIFYLNENESIFWSRYEKDKADKYLILNGSCTVQIGKKISRYRKGDNIECSSSSEPSASGTSSEDRSITTHKNEFVVIGCVQAFKSDNKKDFNQFKYSKLKRDSMVTELNLKNLVVDSQVSFDKQKKDKKYSCGRLVKIFREKMNFGKEKDYVVEETNFDDLL